MSNLTNNVEPVGLYVADISGYTDYMAANAKTLAHSHAIISELIEGLAAKLEPLFVIAKLEGDAIFFFRRKNEGIESWKVIGSRIAEFLGELPEAFKQHLEHLKAVTHCHCNACRNIDKLRLKIIIHSGEALFFKVQGNNELAGIDVIIVHQLLKNDLGLKEYILATDLGYRDHGMDDRPDYRRVKGHIVGQGQTALWVHEPKKEYVESTGAHHGLRVGAIFTMKLWFAPLVKRRKFRHLPDKPNLISGMFLKIITFALTPVYLPVGLISSVSNKIIQRQDLP
jgi:hypothetical protein